MLRNLLVVVGLFVTSIVLGQKGGVVKGYVYEKGSQTPFLYTNVILEDTVQGRKFGANTNEQGYYQISQITPGTYDLVVKTQSYTTHREKVEVKSGSIQVITVYMEESVDELGPLTIVGEEDKTKNVSMSMTPATSKDIKMVPMVGGTKDIVTYLTAAVPGAITTGDQGGQVYIRGGSPIQNKVLLDGMIVYNPFHSIGFFSVFDTDIIRSADIYTGGFGAEYGGRISSVMDIKTVDGNKEDFSGRIEATPFGAKTMVNGPIWNTTQEGGSSASYVFSAKTSYLEYTSPAVYEYVNGEEGLPFNFLDLYGKVAINGAGGSKFNVFGFNFRDQVKYQAISDLNWNSWGVGSNFTLVPQSSPVLIEGNFSVSDYRIQLDEENLESRYSNVGGFNFGMDFTYYAGDNEVKYGVSVQGFKTGFSTFNSVGRVIEQNQNTTELAGYVLYKHVSKNKRWVFNPSFRLHNYAALNAISPEPRLGVKFNATENLRFKFAGGMYSQNLIQANSDRDVVNLFYGFLSGPDNLQSEFVTENGDVRDVKHKLQKANHYIVGFEYDLMDKITTKTDKEGKKKKERHKISVNVEGYIKDFRQLTNMNRNKIYEDSQTDKPEVLRKDFIIETGLARGVDFLVKYSGANKFFWVVYSIGKVDRWDGFITYSPVFDRRHNINLVGTIQFGKDKTWEMNHRWNFGSGFPFTQTAGFYEPMDFNNGIGTDYTTTNSGELGIIYGGLNEGRLPSYHRYDLTISKSFKFFQTAEDGSKLVNKDPKSMLMVTAGVTNMYNRQNVFYVNRVTNEVVRQLPIMPSVGLSYEF